MKTILYTIAIIFIVILAFFSYDKYEQYKIDKEERKCMTNKACREDRQNSHAWINSHNAITKSETGKFFYNFSMCISLEHCIGLKKGYEAAKIKFAKSTSWRDRDVVIYNKNPCLDVTQDKYEILGCMMFIKDYEDGFQDYYEE